MKGTPEFSVLRRIAGGVPGIRPVMNRKASPRIWAMRLVCWRRKLTVTSSDSRTSSKSANRRREHGESVKVRSGQIWMGLCRYLPSAGVRFECCRTGFHP